MITFKYTARDGSTGKKVSSVVSASSREEAAKVIIDQGYSPLSITPQTSGKGFLASFRGRIKAKERVIFARQLSTLINAGLPLTQGLRSVADQTDNKAMKVIVSDLITDVEAGKTFSDSLSRHPGVFNTVFISLVRAGESSGTLDKALERIATQQEKDAEVISKVRGALVYPLIVLLVMVAVVTFMMVAVLPQVEELYAGLKGASLPLVTKVLIAVSNFMISFWWLIVLLLVGLGFFGRRWVKYTKQGRYVADKSKMNAPLIGQLFMKLYMARFARTASTLVASGVPLIQVLEIVSEAINNSVIAQAIQGSISKVKGGKALSDTLENNPSFLPLVPKMLKIGEQSGAIESMMERTADYYEKEVDNQIKTIGTIIEPTLMVILGVVAITIVAAILLPIYSLVGQNVLR